MQAILSKIISATNTKPTRIKAQCARGSITLSHPFDLTNDALHVWAVDQLIARFVKEDIGRYGSDPKLNPWASKRVCGCLPNGDYAHVFTAKR